MNLEHIKHAVAGLSPGSCKYLCMLRTYILHMLYDLVWKLYLSVVSMCGVEKPSTIIWICMRLNLVTADAMPSAGIIVQLPANFLDLPGSID
jgi:hypothetical protein